ncbi:glycosyltransferase [Nakamurella lactea]|uniref:glycosyltransferase n=1 Tax=Nakamurella lactea TaxID=459515 RepID=UPI000560496A|nr:nucleotide disphospho-sugar-binding domain-containing protein [Nakamurella lactea]
MASILLCSTPVHGHVSPLLPIARQLVDAGHRVRFLTGARYRAAVQQTGADWLALPPAADYDDRTIDETFPGRVGLTGPAKVRYDMVEIFLRPVPEQAAAVAAAIDAEPTDVVLAESLFLGIMPLLMTPRAQRPAVLNLGIVPLGLISRDTAPFGLGLPPMAGPIGRLRNRLLTILTTRLVFRTAQAFAQQQVRAVTGRAFGDFFLNWMAHADGVIQLSVEGFEYPRSDLPVPVHFVGPVSASTAAHTTTPPWWGELDGSRPVVHVSQGTIANNDFDELIRPTLRALAEMDVLVVVTTGGRDIAPLRAELPSNARVADYLPYDELFTRTTVFVSNGGYGGVHFALRHGVPLVVAGKSEDKADVSARVAWSGAGVDLRTNRPTPEAIADAVGQVLADPSYRAASLRLAQEIAGAPGAAGVVPIIEQVAGVSTMPVSRR